VTSTRLTEYSHGAGCACKLSPDELSLLMEPVRDHPATSHSDLLVGVGGSDDAGVFDLGDGRAMVQTIDIFTPVVDQPGDWGRIAAANALSDVYAMGATPVTALQYLAWPRDELDFELARQVIAGGLSVMLEAGCTVVGGHSIDGLEPAYGFAVTGLAGCDSYFPNSRAAAGDKLVLTKPLGIGIITTAIKRGQCPPDAARRAIETMTTLNDVAGRSLSAAGAHAATDVTGFGLLGHLRELCLASGVGATVSFSKVPVLEGARELLDDGMWAGGSQRNLKSIIDFVETEVGEGDLRLLADAQTSGGLLVALSPASTAGYLRLVPGAVEVGEVTTGSGIRVVA
jgi:selenide,water dikinase